MKIRIFYIAIFVSLNMFSQGELNLSTNQNYIATRTYMSSDGNHYLDAIQYFDGFGRPIQSVERGITPDNKDLVSIQEYDGFGRVSNTWLPGKVTVENNGAFVPIVTAQGYIRDSNKDSTPYSTSVYELSPMNRVTKQFGPGQDWHNKGKAVETNYMTNIENHAVLNSILYSVDGTNQSPVLKNAGNYTSGQLYVTEVKGEDKNISYEFKNKQGQVILTRQIDGDNHDTYYVYNNFGNLCFVLPPKIQEEGWTQDKLNLLAYQYKYDNRNRCIWKKLPGCEPVYYIYDKADRLIFSQDGEQRTKNMWTYSIPDAIGRIVLTGTCTNVLDYTSNPLKSVIVKGEETISGAGSYKGYNISGIALNNAIILTVNYYDSHNFLNKNIESYLSSQYLSFSNTFGTGCINDHKGLLTGTLKAILRPEGTATPEYIFNVMYYDTHQRLIESRYNDHLGGWDSEYISYNFSGQPLQRIVIDGNTYESINYKYNYDHAGRLKKSDFTISDWWHVDVAENTYDDLGRLQKWQAGSNSSLWLNYNYNVRSWVTAIFNDNLFRTHIHYNEPFGDSQPTYNGNISIVSSIIPGEAWRQYNYYYDNLSRLKEGRYYGPGQYSTSYSYDKHGNMKTLQRYGKINAVDYGLVDSLKMNYTGNQLMRVNDSGINVAIGESADFKNYNNLDIEYGYNQNGSMVKDLNKGISNIKYNLLNLPGQMDIMSPLAEARNEYTYLADGQKMQVVQKWNENFNTQPVIGSDISVSSLNMQKTTDYVNGFVIELKDVGNDQFFSQKLMFEGGYVDYNTGEVYYYIRDHLGNNRLVAKQDGTIIQKNYYYPFGTAFADKYDDGSNQPYKYNGKELDQMHGLNLYDYSARYYESAIGRFTTVDPHAENYYSWSPYHYAANNPLLITDPTGMDWYRNEDGTAYIWRKGSDETYTHTIGEGDNAISMTMSRVGETYVQMLSDGTKMVWNQQNLESMTEPQSFEQGTMSKMEKWKDIESISYNIVNDMYVTGQGLVHLLSLGTVGRNRVNELTGEKEYANLDGTTNYKAEFNAVNMAAMVFTGSSSKLGTAPKGLGYINKLGAAQFSHTFKGSLSKFSPATRGILNKTLNKGINSYNNQISNGMIVFKVKGLSPKRD